MLDMHGVGSSSLPSPTIRDIQIPGMSEFSYTYVLKLGPRGLMALGNRP